ncbi:MAG: hypothetical protein K0U34_02490, partial [Alphaproteobacteria bacterium]|nr:hypothetical protein [Alphaproteobacteria bacterium]
MTHSRRRVLASLASGLVAVQGLAWPSGSAARVVKGLAKRRRAKLPDWAYGSNSVADDAMLMFRGNGTHTFYGTGPIPEKAPKVAWRFRTAARRTTLRGKPVVWSGTGWTGTAV